MSCDHNIYQNFLIQVCNMILVIATILIYIHFHLLLFLPKDVIKQLRAFDAKDHRVKNVIKILDFKISKLIKSVIIF